MSRLLPTLPAALALLLAAGCVAPADDAIDVAATSAALTDPDPVQACPLPDPAHLAGHEAVFYTCAETVADGGAGCGPTGYLLGYGTRYAQRFYRDTRPRMTARGQRWIDDVLVCLQHDLRDAIDATTSCDDIWQTAFDSHPACYVDAGFCTLSIWDIAQVVRTIDVRDWVSADAARQVVTTAARCGAGYAWWMRTLFGALADD
ncbi:MAG: hypothetical protein H6709_00160 [Kofleriaceae bacterium]|nr:hypothetical protein [Myxococcales bacterium]MCB9558961.1 hypothetical protein [Kofleriaceae bacterium]MCB9570479.1 hypothetical protein [Kofleriaceae bacterium]